jgi:hypothetical protein
MEERSRMNRYLAGGVAGVIATAVMTVAITLGKRAGLLHIPPPEQVTTSVTNKAQPGAEAPAPGFTPGSLLAHHAFGAAGGVGYVVARRFLPDSPPLAGLAWAGLIWVTAYAGVLPALKLYPWPDQDRASRMAVMIGAHAVHGAVLAEAEKRLAD